MVEAITSRVISSMVIVLALKSIAIPNSFHGVVPRTRSCGGLISLCTWPHQVLTRTLSYQSTLEVQLSLGLTPLGDPIQSISRLWNQPFQVGTHHGLSLVRKTRCLLLWLRSNRTPALMLCVVLVTTVVTILRFTITPTTAAVCIWWVLYCGCYATVFLKVLVTASAVVPFFRLTPHHSY